MRKLVLAASGALLLGSLMPASAQSIYVDDGYRGWGGHAWGSGPRARVYIDSPRYRYRSRHRDWDGAYAFGGYRHGWGGW